MSRAKRARGVVLARALARENERWEAGADPELRKVRLRIVHDRPRTRGDCASVPRPCPYVGCRYNLFLEENKNTLKLAHRFGISFTHPEGVEPWDVDPAKSCALDVAEEEGVTLEHIAGALGMTREAVRQIVEKGLEKLARKGLEEVEGDPEAHALSGVDGTVNDDPRSKSWAHAHANVDRWGKIRRVAIRAYAARTGDGPGVRRWGAADDADLRAWLWRVVLSGDEAEIDALREEARRR